LAFIFYSALNIGLTGVSVPSGNFTGSMLIGGLAGRVMGALVRGHGPEGVAVSGVYAMVGSAAMLCGFKQMSLAVVIFIAGCANDFELMPPLMVSVTVALLLNKAINERGFDEEQIIKKNIPFLLPEQPRVLDDTIAMDLLDNLTREATLGPTATVEAIKQALALNKDFSDFPVVRDGICIGYTTRERMEEAFRARAQSSSSGSGAAPTSPHRLSAAGDLDELSRLVCGAVGRESSLDSLDAVLPVSRLTDMSPYTLLHSMPAPRLYALFSLAGVRVACVVGENGEYRGTISRKGLIETVRRIEAEAEKEEYEDF